MTFFSSLVLLFFVFFVASSTDEKQKHGFTVEIIHPNSPRSPFYNTVDTRFKRVSNVVRHSINRVHYLNRLFFDSSSNNTPQSILTPYVDQCYVMSYSIGTPPVQLYGVIDTASDLIWFQCKPCKACYNQTSPMFDPSKSSSYKTIPCTSRTCKKNVKVVGGCSNNNKKCEYQLSYLDSSESQGYLSEDILTLTSSNDGSPISFSKFVLGCGHKNKFSVNGKISGILGLGHGALSLVSQLSSSIHRKFSYCLVPFFANDNTSSKLNFGNTAVVYGTGTVSTPLVQGIYPSLYGITLEAFSVGNKTIKLDNSTYALNKPGIAFIDSGSTFTHLPPTLYYRLESAVAAMIKLKRVKDPTQQMSLCYKTTSKNLRVPIITAHFSGADVHLNALHTFIPIDHEVMCFAFLPNELAHLVIFGNIAQQKILVGFDLVKNTISFKPTDCINY